MPLFRRGILWSVKIWSAVATFLLGLVGASPQAIGAEARPGPSSTGAANVAAQSAATPRATLAPLDVHLTQEDLAVGPFMGTTRWMPPEKGREAFTLAGPWALRADGGFGQTLNGQTLVIYRDGSSKIFDAAGAILGTRQDPVQLQLFNALQKSAAMAPPTTR